MSGSIQADGTLTHFEKEFTADIDDSNCALVLEFKGSGTVKVEHLSLIAVDDKQQEIIPGDTNLDGKTDTEDVILLQKWLREQLHRHQWRLGTRLSYRWRAGGVCACAVCRPGT